jgi:hypothetical protein
MISITGMSRTSPNAATTKSNALFINLAAAGEHGWRMLKPAIAVASRRDAVKPA